NEQNPLTVTHDLTVDGITRRPGVVADDRAWAADQAVDQARLADVGSTDDGDRHRRGDLFDRRRFGKPVDNRIEQVARAFAVQRRHKHWLAEAQRRELGRGV